MLNGDEAAALAVATFVSAIVRYTPKFTGRDSLVMAVNDANLAVYEKLRGDGGTTLAAALFSDDGGMWGINVGDSRIYRYNPKSELIQLSIDDTVAGRAEHSRAASFEILRSTEFGARLTQFIGMGRELNSSIVDLSQVSGNGGILLATDGIWKAGHDGFSKIVLQAPNADSIGKRLLRYSNWCGGIDNASVIVVSNPTDIMRKNPVENREYGEANSYVDVWNAYGKLTLFPEVILEKSLSKKDGTVRKSRKRTKLNLPIK
jgi:serine/threonine protein phosphatase PrpC